MAFLKGNKDEITVRTDVVIQVDLGKTEKVRFQTTWRKPTVTETRAFFEAAKDEDLDEDAVIRDRLIGWTGLVGDDGETLEFSQSVLEEMLENRDYRNALASSYLEVVTGKPQAKN